MKDLKRTIGTFWDKNEPEIFTGLGIGSLIFSTGYGIYITFKTSKLIQKLKTENKDISKSELFKKVWLYYIPVVLACGLSITSIILGNKAMMKKNAALMAAYTMAESAYREYRDQTLKTVGEVKEQQIREKVVEEKMEKQRGNKDVVISGNGDSLFYEPLSGRYFYSNWNKIQKASNFLNAKAVSSFDGYTSLSDWFDELGLDKTDISDNLGWDIVNGPERGIIDISITATIGPNDAPCGSICYNSLPKPIQLY